MYKVAFFQVLAGVFVGQLVAVATPIWCSTKFTYNLKVILAYDIYDDIHLSNRFQSPKLLQFIHLKNTPSHVTSNIKTNLGEPYSSSHHLPSPFSSEGMDLSSLLENVGASATGSVVSKLVCYPLDTIAVQYQTSTRQPLTSIPFKQYYRGIGVTILTVTPATAIYLTTREAAHVALLPRLGDGAVNDAVCLLLIP